MAKDHYLPAAFIGRFSKKNTGPARNRPIWVNNSRASKVIQTTPSNIGFKRGLYNLSNGKSIDGWGYEQQLNRVLNDIGKGKSISLDDYLRVAVPFVTGLFVRGKEFNVRYENIPTIKHLAESDLINPDNTNMSRAMRLQKMLTPVTSARWVVLHNHSNGIPILSNDLGLVPTMDMLTGDTGWAVPLDASTVLGVFPSKSRHIATFHSGSWWAQIEHVYPDPQMFIGINNEIAKTADEFVFGPTKESVESVVATREKQPDDFAYIMEWSWTKMFTGRELSQYDFHWYYLAGIAHKNVLPEGSKPYRFILEDVGMGEKWSPSIPLLPGDNNASTGITFEKNSLYLNLS